MESKIILSERIRERRVQKGYSQEYLADSANISIRTLQRIEGGQSDARGHTLIALADALDIAIEDLMDFTKVDNRSILHAINLSALAYWMIPIIGNILLPLILWIINKDKINGVNQFGKRQIFIQILWTVLMVVSLMLMLLHVIPMFVGVLLYSLNTLYVGFVFIMILRDKHIPMLGLG